MDRRKFIKVTGFATVAVALSGFIKPGKKEKKVLMLCIGDGVPDCVYDFAKNKKIGCYHINVSAAKSSKKNALGHIILTDEPREEKYDNPILKNHLRYEYSEEYDEQMKIALTEILKEGYSSVLIVSCLGGGAGCVVSPLAAKYVKEFGGKVNAVVTTPFDFEGRWKKLEAVVTVSELKRICDKVEVIKYEEMRSELGNVQIGEAFRKLDEKILQLVKTELD